jgi:hypothetical protein
MKELKAANQKCKACPYLYIRKNMTNKTTIKITNTLPGHPCTRKLGAFLQDNFLPQVWNDMGARQKAIPFAEAVAELR